MSNLMNALAQAGVLRAIVAGTYTSTETGTGVDVSAWDGIAVAVLDSSLGGGTTPTLNVTLEDSDAVGGTYAAIPGAAFVEVDDTAGGSTQVIAFDVGAANGFVRAVGTIAGGGSETFDFSVTLLGIPKAA